MEQFISKITAADKAYGLIRVSKLNIENLRGKPVLLIDSLGEIIGKFHNSGKRIDGLTEWHKTRMTNSDDEISISFDEKEVKDGKHVIHIEFLTERRFPINEVETNFFSFELESQLEKHISNNIEQLEKGLTKVKQQYNIGGSNIIDLLCIDANRNYVVVEFKNRKTSDIVVGQILRYIGRIKEIEKVDNVRGIIVTPEPDTNLEYAISTLPHVSLKYFKFNVTFSEPEMK